MKIRDSGPRRLSDKIEIKKKDEMKIRPFFPPGALPMKESYNLYFKCQRGTVLLVIHYPVVSGGGTYHGDLLATKRGPGYSICLVTNGSLQVTSEK